MFNVSRKDIDKDQFQEFDVDRRFIKLPVEKYLGLINIEATPPQIAVVNAINNPRYRFVCAALSRRLGKTFIANVIGQLVSLMPGSNVLIMSPNYSLSSISFEEQRKLIRCFDLEVTKDNSKDRIIELENGSTIRMGSVSQVDSCVGRSYDLIIFDEAALTDAGEDAFQIALRPTLDKDNSKAIFISTPRGKNNWFSRYFNRGFLPEYSSWASIHADWRENPRVHPSDIEDARRSMTVAQFKQEYEASFTSFEGQIFRFDYDRCVYESGSIDTSKFEIVIGLDIGFKDPTAACVLGHDYETGNWYVLDEYQEAEKTSDHYAENIKALAERWGAEYVFIDSAAQQTRFDWAAKYDLSTTNANKSQLDGIAYCQVLVENNRLFVSSHCQAVLATLDQYKWDAGATLIRERPNHDEYSHMADALRYGLYSYATTVSSV